MENELLGENIINDEQINRPNIVPILVPLFSLEKVSDNVTDNFSESGSITPSTIKDKIFAIPSEVNKEIQKATENQLHLLSNLRMQNNLKLEELNKQITLTFNKYQNIAQNLDIKTKITFDESHQIEKLFLKQQDDLEKLLSFQNLLDNIVEHLPSEYPLDGLVLKTYKYGIQTEIEQYSQVKRFTIVAERLNSLADNSLGADILHPLELVLFNEAFKELHNSKIAYGVICDIFARKDNQIPKTETGFPETHSIVLWKDFDDIEGDDSKKRIFIIDPNKSAFSSKLINPLRTVFNIEIEEGMQGTLYAAENKSIGRKENDARDCIDIAVKLIFELIDQTISDNENKSIKQKLDIVLSQLSTEAKFAKHFTKNSNKQMREFTSSSSEIRHLVLRVAKSIMGIK